MRWWKYFSECKKANLTELNGKLFNSRIEALQELAKLNPKKVITFDRRCSEIEIDGNIVFTKFNKVNNQFKLRTLEFYDKTQPSGWDTYITDDAKKELEG